MNLEGGSLFAGSSAPDVGERVHRLSTGAGWWIEQILSGTLAAPVDDVLDHEEWVVLMEGSAVLEVDGTVVTLDRGDWIRLGPGTPHRVRTTRPGTSWLAVHLPTQPAVATDRGSTE